MCHDGIKDRLSSGTFYPSHKLILTQYVQTRPIHTNIVSDWLLDAGNMLFWTDLTFDRVDVSLGDWEWS